MGIFYGKFKNWYVSLFDFLQFYEYFFQIIIIYIVVNCLYLDVYYLLE